MRTSTALRGTLTLASAAMLALGLTLPAAASTTDPSDEETASLQRALRSGRPLLGWTIALDPGHNGGNSADPAAINQLVSDGRGDLKPCNTVGTATASGYAEHEFNFDVAERLTTHLERLGATVVLTREDDESVGPCVDIRGRFAVDADADLMISIHANGSLNTTTEGYFAIVADPAISESQGEPSLSLADDLLGALADGGFTPSTAVEDALSLRSDLATLNFARRPAVMLELGEMRNPDDAALMESEEGRQAYADAIAAGILTWTEDNEPRD
ncbi:N-acetylmuramoyl-L-alanine amidase family protein [Pseudactinotalea sp.]|uniref:N-acetylmuramoyl-L-alanine amidase family protein n=1 Tax=Pseudactinotalea sp. TaxID=1926260 RepID=UPI003B3B26E6